MKKIKHLSDLKVQQLELKLEQKRLEHEIANDWSGIKSGLRPRNLSRNFLGSVASKLKNTGALSLSALVAYRLLRKWL